MADSQQPPENPFESRHMPELEGNTEDTLLEGAPEVAAKTGKAFLMLGIIGAVVLFLLYMILFSGGKEEVKEQPKQLTVAPKTFEPPPLPTAEAPPMVAPPSILPPSIPEPQTISIPTIKSVNPLTPKEDSAAKAQSLARMRSPIMAGGSSGGSSALGSLLGGKDDPSKTKVEKVTAGRIQNLSRTIAQGRIIQATMETALSTDLKAPIRAIVSRDTYGEAGTTPLIPKGSRLIGTYEATVGSGASRVAVIWTRVIRPDGIDVMLDSPLIDQIGRAGVSGQVDSKFQEIFARSMLSSVINIALAIGAEKINGGGTTTTTTPSQGGGSQTTGDGATTATTNALNRLGGVTDQFVQKFINVPPTILIDQGTNVNVFVNKDIVFPADLVGANIVN